MKFLLHKGGLHLFKQLAAVGSRDLSQAEKNITVVKAEQIQKMAIIFTQKGQTFSFWVKIVVVIFLICPALATAWDKSSDSIANFLNKCRLP